MEIGLAQVFNPVGEKDINGLQFLNGNFSGTINTLPQFTYARRVYIKPDGFITPTESNSYR
jgi:hypothetical protein